MHEAKKPWLEQREFGSMLQFLQLRRWMCICLQSKYQTRHVAAMRYKCLPNQTSHS